MSVFESLLNRTFTIQRRTRASDGQGGWTIGYTTLGAVRGRIRPATGREREVAASEERQISHVLYVVAGEDLERGDRVTYSDLTVEVLGIREPSRAGKHLEIDCLEIQVEVTTEVAGLFWPEVFWPEVFWPLGFWAGT